MLEDALLHHLAEQPCGVSASLVAWLVTGRRDPSPRWDAVFPAAGYDRLPGI